jgi:tartrate-resistant acid phosphatase type 5
MKVRRLALVFAVLALLSLSAAPAQPADTQPAPPAVALTEPVLARLPVDWRQPAVTLLKATDAEQQRFLTMSAEVLRQTVARLLARLPAADAFLRSQLGADPSPRVRATIVQVMAADPRWMALPDTAPLLEGVVALDPDPDVSLAALETLRRRRMRELNTLLNERLAVAKKRGDVIGVTRLAGEQERWVHLERGTMLPAFLVAGSAPFSVKPVEAPVRVLAFGDFGNGSAEQRALAQTIAVYHRDRPLDFAVTLGDNFYDRGMESPTDPRWQTWFEQLYGSLGITFYAALGNHDWGHPDSPAAEILYSQQTTTWRMPASYYTFTAGAAQFFALDTQSIALAEKQLQWLDGELARSQARWKIVYGHHPIFSGGAYRDRPDLIAKLLPLLQGRADVYICGHDHNLQALRPEGSVHFYVAGGGGAGLYELRPYERSIFASRSNGFAVIDADRMRLSISLVDGSGQTIYEETLKKDAAPTPPPR